MKCKVIAAIRQLSDNFINCYTSYRLTIGYLKTCYRGSISFTKSYNKKTQLREQLGFFDIGSSDKRIMSGFGITSKACFLLGRIKSMLLPID